jgi:hypothetical protein
MATSLDQLANLLVATGWTNSPLLKLQQKQNPGNFGEFVKRTFPVPVKNCITRNNLFWLVAVSAEFFFC